MKKLLVIAIVLFSAFNLNAQRRSDEEIVRQIADKILSESSYKILDRESGKVYSDPANFPVNDASIVQSPYLEWKYWNGLLYLTMLDLGEVLNEKKYSDYVRNNYAFLFDNKGYFQKLKDAGAIRTGCERMLRHKMLDDCGTMGAGLIETYKKDKREDYREYMDKTANYILNEEHRLEDGTLAREIPFNKTVWLDDMFMGISFLARMGDFTGDDKYFDFSVKQVKQFHKYLFNENNQLFYHCWYDDIKENGVAHWGRANGWAAIALTNLLQFMPENHKDRDEMLRLFRKQIIGLTRYQGENGLWHQLLDKEDSYLETSCSAMFIYSLAKGINEGWIDKRYNTVAREGWKGLKTKITPEGDIEGICKATDISTSLFYYYKRPTPLNDIHGIGVVFAAGVEMMKLMKR